MAQPTTKSERLFASYLNENGFSGRWEFEPQVPGQKKTPDFVLHVAVSDIYFEVKERNKQQQKGAIWADLYTGIRDEINETARKFKALKDHSCNLVIYGIDDREFSPDPLTVFGAMLGNPGFLADYDTQTGAVVVSSIKNVFLQGGKMIDQKRRSPQNTTISSVIVLEKSRQPDLGFLQEERKRLVRLKAKWRKAITPHDAISVNIDLVRTREPGSEQIRVIVFENPYARIPMPSDILCGPFDERWRMDEHFVRVFVGERLRAIERFKAEADPDPLKKRDT